MRLNQTVSNIYRKGLNNSFHITLIFWVLQRKHSNTVMYFPLILVILSGEPSPQNVLITVSTY